MRCAVACAAALDCSACNVIAGGGGGAGAIAGAGAAGPRAARLRMPALFFSASRDGRRVADISASGAACGIGASPPAAAPCGAAGLLLFRERALAERDLRALVDAALAQVAALDVARRVQVVAERDRRARGQRRAAPRPSSRRWCCRRPPSACSSAWPLPLSAARCGTSASTSARRHVLTTSSRASSPPASRIVTSTCWNMPSPALASRRAIELHRDVAVVERHAAHLRQPHDVHARRRRASVTL